MELVWYVIILLILLGFTAGLISSLAGIGGGAFYVTIMVFILNIPLKVAIDTSTFVILFASCAGFITHYRAGRIDLKQVLIFSIFTIIGALTCMLLLQFIVIHDFLLTIIFGITILIAGINMLYKAYKTRKTSTTSDDKDQESEFNVEQHDYKANFKKAIPLFFIAGFASYLLGIGGGMINTPVLSIVLHYPIHNATATSTGIVFITAIFNTALKSIYGQIDYVLGAILAIGTVAGYALGARVSGRIPKFHLQVFVGLIIIILGISMFF